MSILSLSEPCRIFDKAFELIKKDLITLLAIHTFFSAPFWTGLFYFFVQIGRPGRNYSEQIDFLILMSLFLTLSLFWLLAGKIFLTLASTQSFMNEKSGLLKSSQAMKGRFIRALSAAALLTSSAMVTIFFVFPPLFFYLSLGLCLPLVLLEEESSLLPIRSIIVTIFNNFFFMIKLMITGGLIFLLVFINTVYGILFGLSVLGFFHLIDSHSINLRVSSPYFLLFCAMLAFSFFDFFWTVSHTLYFFTHSSERTGKDLLVRLRNISSHEEMD